MNTENILALADLIEQLPEEQFDMREYLHPDCGTPACIAGWAAWLQLDRPTTIDPLSVLPEAFAYFGERFSSNNPNWEKLTRDLFIIGYWDAGDIEYITNAKAARTLRHFAATGEVNWELPE